VRKNGLVIGSIIIIYPVYHHLLWLYIWQNYGWLSQAEKVSYFKQYAILSEPGITLLSFILPIVAIVVIVNGAKEMTTIIQKLLFGTIIALATLSWLLTIWSIL
tara:strand:+ start:23975 stop:24286 length:312 start_codon:yes stop_codon:yes gene_type:complete